MRRYRRSTTVQKSAEDLEREYLTIKQSLLQNIAIIEERLQKIFSSPKPWKFQRADHVLVESNEVIDLVFEHSAPDDKRFVVVDICVPYLARGQKYTLDTKAKQFQKEQGVAAVRVKKALLMLKRSGETLAPPSTKLSSRIIELDISVLTGEEAPPVQSQPEKAAAPVFTPELLEALKRTIVHECLGTMYKRRNKYIRKGLWRWIEREIMDPNVHFFLIILSSIYQGKTSEILSRQFKTVEEYSGGSEKIIEALFSNENGLAPEILKNAERHKQGLRRFLACFEQTPPFEYLRTLFLKEFRTSRDSNKARIAVFDTLRELLSRCGFEGEKEVQYPLEILDELSIFPGFIMGNYAQLRVENASKKLQKLVPEHTWNADEIYKLRDELARVLGLPPAEFNLNAFLPQAFLRDNLPAHQARGMEDAMPAPQQHQRMERDRGQQNAQRRPERQPSPPSEPAPAEQPDIEQPRLPFEGAIPGSRADESALGIARPDTAPPPLESARPQGRPQRPMRASYRATADIPVQTSISQTQEAAPLAQPPVETAAFAAAPDDAQKLPPAILPQPRPPMQHGQGQRGQQQQQQRFQNQPFGRQSDLDEARHRYFENFGGHTEEDLESVRFMLDMERVVSDATRAPVRQVEAEIETGYDDQPPPKGGRPPVRQFQNQGMPREPRQAPQNGMRAPNQGDSNRRRRGKRRHHRSGGNRPPMPRMPQ
ncbi:MAG TPA: hypothetical protein PLU72_07595 [Candidatus Ozemobacteraceae bacterium]|nr:hypothetical protein [Candidatus Ozemobacteraceae bacterium]